LNILTTIKELRRDFIRNYKGKQPNKMYIPIDMANEFLTLSPSEIGEDRFNLLLNKGVKALQESPIYGMEVTIRPGDLQLSLER
jgi:hypothetical protein